MPAPNITSLSPTTGGLGTSVIITGTDFGTSQSTNTISFNGASATPTSWTMTSIVVPVPNGASTGNIAITVDGMSSNEVLFAVSPLPPPASIVPPEFLPKQLFDSRMKATDVLQEHLKQVITVASATLVLTVSFIKDVIGSPDAVISHGWLLPVSWIALAISIPCAILTIAILVNHLDKPNLVKGRSGYQKSFAAGATSTVVGAVWITFFAFSVGMTALGGFGALNYQVLLRKASGGYQFLSEAKAIEITKRNLPANSEFVHTVRIELEQSNPKLPGSLAVWHVRVQVKQPAASSSQPPVYAMFDYYVNALTGQGAS